MEKKSHNESEIDRVMKKKDEFDSQAIDVAAGDDPLSQKAMNPDTISGNVWARGKGKKGKKG
jgi:hypothetical protein